MKLCTKKKTIFSFVLIIILMLPTVVFAQPKNKIYIGEVTKVLDSEAFEIRIVDGGNFYHPIKFRLIGINTNASEEAYEFVHAKVMNQIVIIETETPLNPDKYDEWQFGYIKFENTSLNSSLLSHGLADLDESFVHYRGYKDLIQNYEYAKQNLVGKWNEGEVFNPYEERVNINTATSSQLVSTLEDTTYTLANAIYTYRKYNVIENIEELSFISDKINNEWLEKNKRRIMFSTNINTAEEYELNTLFSNSNNIGVIAKNIVDYRLENRFRSIVDLKKIKGVTDEIFDDVKLFVSMDYKSSISIPKEKKVNVNTASEKQMVALKDLSSGVAKNIEKYRDSNKYSFKSLQELRRAANVSEYNVNKIQDDINLYTDLNNASLTELESLFGKFNISKSAMKSYASKIYYSRPFENPEELRYVIPAQYYQGIKSFVYVDDEKREDRINLNLASKSDLKTYLGLTEKQAEYVVKSRKYKKYYNYTRLPYDLNTWDNNFVLYTNINDATIQEIKLLHESITYPKASEIRKNLDEKKVTSEEELQKLFTRLNCYKAFNEIKNFVVYQ